MGGDVVRLTGGLAIPRETADRVRAVREGVAFYGRLPVYERYALAKAGGEAGLVLAAAALLAFFVARTLSRSLSRPIGALVEGTRRVRSGDLGHRIPSASGDEIGALVESFNEMTRELRESREKLVRAERVALWAEAARRIAHEIRNPLTPITLSLHRLAKRAEALPAEERRALEELLEPMTEEVENLRSLADAFSQFSRLPSPKMEAVDVRDLLEKVASLYGRGTDATATIEVAPGTPAVRGDRELLWRVFSNLVKNAVEAMGEAGSIALRARRLGDSVEVLVSDTGPGIDAETRERIFAPTYTTKPGGSGLGLALVERVVHEHGGSVSVEPNAPRGTTFRVLLPAER
jgi:nitrogen fixation/metabolism regulation signal transduction histidine kinase